MNDVLAQITLDLADGSGADTVTAAIVAGVALVLSVVIPTLIERRKHEPKEPKAVLELRAREKDLRNELARDRDEWKERAEDLDRALEQAVQGMELRGAEIDRLRQLCVDNGINPFIPIPKVVPDDASP